jgi:hypothetical protein
MKLREIFDAKIATIFLVVDGSTDNELDWTIEPSDHELIPDDENLYFVKAKQVSTDNTLYCYIGIVTPERIAETIIKKDSNGQIVCESIYDQKQSVMPAVASECFGDYNLFYSKENPEIGIDILKNGLNKAKNKNIVSEDLGYILRDENRISEAIEAFKISEEFGPSSAYIFLELSQLYGRLGLDDKRAEYENKFRKAGGPID